MRRAVNASAPGSDASPAPERPLRGARGLRRATAVLVAVAALVGVGARFWGLAEKPLWHDEVYTRIFAAGHASGDWIGALYTGRPVSRDAVLAFQRLDPEKSAFDTARGLARDEPQHPPAYYVLARLWMGLFGDGVGPLRALSLVASLVALLAAAWLGRELFPTRGPPATARVARRARALFVALVAASPFAVLYAQEAREYSLWTVAILASTAALLRALRLTADAERPAVRVRAWAGYALLTAFGLYTSFSHATVILAHILFIAVHARGRLDRRSVPAALALAASGLLFAPWAVLLATHLDAFAASMAWSRAIVVPLTEVLTTLATNLSRPLLDLWPTVSGPVAWSAVALTVALVVAALVALARRGPRSARVLLLLLALLPLALLVLPDLAVGGIRSFSARYLFPSLLAVLAAVAWRLAAIARADLRRALIAAVVLVAAASAVRTTLDRVPWTRALSAGLPAVAAAIDAAPHPLVLGDRERHHPGNLLALATQVGPDTTFVLLDHPERAALIARAEAAAGRGEWPPADLLAGHTVFVYAPIPQLRAALDAAAPHPGEPVWDDLYVSCWRLGMVK